MKPQATVKQIQNSKFVLNIILSTFRNMAYIQTQSTWDLFWKVWGWM